MIKVLYYYYIYSKSQITSLYSSGAESDDNCEESRE